MRERDLKECSRQDVSEAVVPCRPLPGSLPHEAVGAWTLLGQPDHCRLSQGFSQTLRKPPLSVRFECVTTNYQIKDGLDTGRVPRTLERFLPKAVHRYLSERAACLFLDVQSVKIWRIDARCIHTQIQQETQRHFLQRFFSSGQL